VQIILFLRQEKVGIIKLFYIFSLTFYLRQFCLALDDCRGWNPV